MRFDAILGDVFLCCLYLVVHVQADPLGLSDQRMEPNIAHWYCYTYGEAQTKTLYPNRASFTYI